MFRHYPSTFPKLTNIKALNQSYNPLLIGSSQIFLDQIDSTNKYLLEYVSKNRPSEGLVVISDYQSHGRGQIGSKWESEKGQNILTSIYIRPNMIANTQVFYLNIIISLAVRAVVEDFLGKEEGIYVKWPNDIYVEGKKICGILVQNVFSGSSLSDSIIGVGLNVNQKEFQNPKATSLAILTQGQMYMNQVQAGLFYYFEQYYNILKTGNLKNLHNQYESYLYQKGDIKSYQDMITDEVFTGSILGIDDFGNLIVQKSNAVKKYSFKEIKYL